MDDNLKNTDERIPWVDACKGIGIVFVVLGHIARGYEGAWLFPDYQQVLIRLGNYAYAFHMTLLFLLSGFVFYQAYSPDRQPEKDHYIGQLLNLVWIFLLYSVLWWAVKQFFPDQINIKLTVSDLVCFLIRPLDPYWYLWVLFFYYLFFYYADKRNVQEKWIWAVVITLSLAGSVFRIAGLEAFRKLFFYATPFYMGIYLSKHNFVRRLGKQIWAVCGVVSVAAMSFITATGKDLDMISIVEIVAALAISIFIIMSVTHIYFLENSRFLNLCGKYSLEIYVLHNYITAANRLILIKLGITEFYRNVVINFFMAVMIPVCIGMVLKKAGLYPFFFKPGRFYKGRHSLG